jgi:hypothetical protein
MIKRYDSRIPLRVFWNLKIRVSVNKYYFKHLPVYEVKISYSWKNALIIAEFFLKSFVD